MSYYSSTIQALMDSFPNIGMDPSKFPVVPSMFFGVVQDFVLIVTGSYWQNPNNRKKFFLEIAEENNFDPLDPNAWYSLRPDLIMHKKGVNGVLTYYGGSYTDALLHLFPDIKLDKLKFPYVPSMYLDCDEGNNSFEQGTSMCCQ